MLRIPTNHRSFVFVNIITLPTVYWHIFGVTQVTNFFTTRVGSRHSPVWWSQYITHASRTRMAKHNAWYNHTKIAFAGGTNSLMQLCSLQKLGTAKWVVLLMAVRRWECPEARIQKGVVCCSSHAHLWLHRWSEGIRLHHRWDLLMLLRHGSHLNWRRGSNLVRHRKRIICHEWIRRHWTIKLLLLPLPVGPIIIKAVQDELVESTTL